MLLRLNMLLITLHVLAYLTKNMFFIISHNRALHNHQAFLHLGVPQYASLNISPDSMVLCHRNGWNEMRSCNPSCEEVASPILVLQNVDKERSHSTPDIDIDLYVPHMVEGRSDTSWC